MGNNQKVDFMKNKETVYITQKHIITKRQYF